jgi:formate dehydrogenase (coenzyme F420) alpha subunit
MPDPSPDTTRLRSACPLCSLACPLELETSPAGLVVHSATGSPSHCTLGPRGVPMLQEGPRLRAPSIRDGEAHRGVGWDEAIAAAAELLQGTLHRHGPNAVAVLSSSGLPLEASWLARQLALDALGTTQVGSVAGALRGGARDDLDLILGRTASTCSLADIADADLVLVVGADLERSHPGLCDHLAAAREAGAELAVLHSSYTRLAAQAEVWLDPRRGSLSVLLAGLLAGVHDQAGGRAVAMSEDLHGALRQATEALQVDQLERTTGCERADLEGLLTLLEGASRVVAIYDLDDSAERSQHDLRLLAGLLATLGKLSSAGSGLLLLGSEANTNGVAQADLHEDLGPQLCDGELRGLLVIGEDPVMHPELAPGLRDLECLVVIDAYPSATAARADVVLPSPSLPESEGTMVATDGCVRAVEGALPPLAGRSLPAILVALAEAMGVEGMEVEPAAIRVELAMDLHLAHERLEQLRADGGRWAWRTGSPGAAPPPEPAPGCWTVPCGARSRLLGLLESRLESKLSRREAS